ncbi:hypothetical protein LguiB_002075 [Lonicera macranthoides]
MESIYPKCGEESTKSSLLSLSSPSVNITHSHVKERANTSRPSKKFHLEHEVGDTGQRFASLPLLGEEGVKHDIRRGSFTQ